MMINVAFQLKKSKVKRGGMTPLTSKYLDLNEFLRTHLSKCVGTLCVVCNEIDNMNCGVIVPGEMQSLGHRTVEIFSTS